jgi:fatty acid desaturase
MPDARFATRDEMAEFEWDNQRKDWKRPKIDREVLKQLSERSTLNGLLRIAYFVLLLAASAVATVYVSRFNLWLAIPVLYVYYFFYGFWVAIVHELQHKTVFSERAEWLDEVFLFFVQTIVWNSPTYARISHRLHHRYTMVRGVDPETDWPEVITTKWLRGFLLNLVLRILVVGALFELYRSVRTQIERAAGIRDRMMRDHCSEKEVAAIRIESAAILLIHAAVVAAAIVFHAWWLLAFVALAWHIGSPIEVLWHATKHIGRPYNVNDHRLNTRSVRVSWFIKLIFWGLDDHVDHHLYPVVPSRNLPKLHRLLEKDLPDPDNVFGCWAEMFEISREKDRDPKREFVSVAAREDAPDAMKEPSTETP